MIGPVVQLDNLVGDRAVRWHIIRQKNPMDCP